MNHSAFLDEMNRLPPDSPQWESSALEYSVLRLVQRWFEGESIEALRSACEVAAQKAGLPVVPCEPIRTLIASISCTRPNSIAKRRVTGALIRLTTHLGTRCRWAPARDVATLALCFCDPDQVALRWRALRLRGAAYRMLGEFELADSDYRRCIRFGKRFGVLEAIVRGRSGIAKGLYVRGNLAAAERCARRNLSASRSGRRPDLASMAHHDLGVTLALMKRFREGMVHLERALVRGRRFDRDRIAHDVALILLERGDLEASRQIFETLIAAGVGAELVVQARINLLQIHSALADRQAVEVQRRELEASAFWPHAEVLFRLTLGQAYIAFGDAAAAVAHIQRADALASEHRFGQVAIDVDAALSRAERIRARASNPQPASSRFAEGVVRSVARAYAVRG